MPRSTIDFGIDLGTTNSEIAVFDGTSTEIIKNIDNFENTSSAVWIDKHGDMIVGQRAKEMFQRDRANAKVRFKLLMGSADHLHFAASGKKLLPEELSAKCSSSSRPMSASGSARTFMPRSSPCPRTSPRPRSRRQTKPRHLRDLK